MDNRLEEVKKILDEMEYELTHGACIVDKNRVSRQICQLFPQPLKESHKPEEKEDGL